jgi:hypothetical protein
MVQVTGTSTGRDAALEHGTSIMVSNGHLHVYGSGSEVIAIFAPGTWRDAVVETDPPARRRPQ